MRSTFRARRGLEYLMALVIFLGPSIGHADPAIDPAKAASEHPVQERPNNDDEFASDFVHLTANQVTDFTNRAINGSPDAALTLGHFYKTIGDPLLPRVTYWYQIAVENGSKDAMYYLGAILVQKFDKTSKRRGVYWLKRAASECDDKYRKFAETSLDELRRFGQLKDK